LTFKGETSTMSWNAGNWLPNDPALYPRIIETSEIMHNKIFQRSYKELKLSSCSIILCHRKRNWRYIMYNMDMRHFCRERWIFRRILKIAKKKHY
jgi:hypothetical protein